MDEGQATKARIRVEMTRRLEALSSSEIEEKGLAIQRKVAEAAFFKKAAGVALYFAYRNEVPTRLLFERGRDSGKRMAFPRICSAKGPLEFYWVNGLEDLTPSPWGPLEPNLSRCFDKAEASSIDLAVIPGLAFDLEGWRLGRGHGFYDRTLKGFAGLRLGIAYAFQMVEKLPHYSGDERVGWIATENRLIEIP